MPEPTVWAVYFAEAFVTALPSEQEARDYLSERWHELPPGYRVAPRALVTPEALAVVRDAIAYIDPPADDPMGYGDDARHAALAASVRHLVDSAAYRAATARDDAKEQP